MQTFFYVRRERRYEQVSFSEIIYVKAKRHYIQIVTEQKTFLVLNTLSIIEKHLPKEMFCRIHHRHIIALSRIKAFDLYWVWLHEAPADKPYKPGLARETKFAVGITYREKLRNSVTVMMNVQGGNHRRFKEAAFELEELEMESIIKN